MVQTDKTAEPSPCFALFQTSLSAEMSGLIVIE